MTIASSDPSGAGAPGHARLWLQIEGAVLIALGIAAIIFPASAGATTAVVFGWILIIMGVLGLVSALSARPHIHLGWSLASAILAIAAGLIIAVFPLAGTTVLVLVVAAWLILDGFSSLRIGLGLKRSGLRPWVWPVVSAIVDWVLAACVLALGPVGGAALVGVIVGIDLILGGVLLLGLGRALAPPWHDQV